MAFGRAHGRGLVTATAASAPVGADWVSGGMVSRPTDCSSGGEGGADLLVNGLFADFERCEAGHHAVDD